MATLNAYSLHDVKALSYSPPFFANNDAIARRMITDLVADPNSIPGRHPSDFKVYKIGTFDDLKGTLTPLAIMEHVVDCVALTPPPSPAASYPPGFAEMMAHAAKANGEAR